MRHRIKKIPTLSKLSHIHNHHLLHSDKSTYTYFYKDKVKSILYSPSIPLLGGAALLLVLGITISPTVGPANQVSAATITEDECRRNTTIGMQLMGTTSDSVNLVNNNVNDDIEAGRISKVSQDFNVVACNAKSYKIYVQAETSMLKNTSVPDALYGVGENVAESVFPENTWGYNISAKGDTSTELTYNTVPELSNSIPEAYSANGSTPTTGKDFTITFAANFSNNKPAGHYTSDILLSSVIEPVTAQELWNSITYMQDMTPEACSGGDELGRQLIDIRDGKSYWVARLKDGNCWMTQNLDLDLDGVTLKPTDSDVASDWTSTTGPSTYEGYNSTDYNKAQYYNIGNYVNAQPTSSEPCIPENNNLDSSDCKAKGWVNISGMNASDNPNFGTNVENNTYNAHYTIGNYYSWNAATAGQSKNISNQFQEATQSICPKGWRLPKGGRDINGNGSPLSSNNFAKLLEQYGYEWTAHSSGPNEDHSPTVVSPTGYNLKEQPMYFLASGSVFNNTLKDIGSNGFYWSSTANGQDVYILGFYPTNVGPSNNYNRYNGFSVRCVAR